MKATVLTMFLALIMVHSVRAQDPPADSDDATWEQAVRAAEARHVAVALANDASAWEGMLSDDFVVNSPLNTIVEKPQLLGFIRSGVLSVSSFEQRIELVRRFGDIAVVMGEDTAVWATPSPNAGQTHSRRFTDIWRLQDGDWRFIARQATLVSN
jgi:ketosteroid isomerase-like protein